MYGESFAYYEQCRSFQRTAAKVTRAAQRDALGSRNYHHSPLQAFHLDFRVDATGQSISLGSASGFSNNSATEGSTLLTTGKAFPYTGSGMEVVGCISLLTPHVSSVNRPCEVMWACHIVMVQGIMLGTGSLIFWALVGEMFQ